MYEHIYIYIYIYNTIDTRRPFKEAGEPRLPSICGCVCFFPSLYVCMSKCTSMYEDMYTSTYAYVHMYVCMHACMYVCMCTRKSTRMYCNTSASQLITGQFQRR